MMKEPTKQVFPGQMRDVASTMTAVEALPGMITATPSTTDGEVAIELAGLGSAHFGLTIQEKERTIRIRAKLIQRCGDVVRRPILITMAHSDAATLARQIAADLKLKDCFWSLVAEDELMSREPDQ